MTAQQCASQTTDHLNFGKLASRIVISNHHKNTCGNFADVTRQLYEFKDVHGIQVPIVNDTYYNTVMKHSERLTQMVDYTRDYLIDYFGFKTLERAYLMKVNGVIIERPQDMWLRVAVAIHNEDMDAVEETYNLMSQKYFTHATPIIQRRTPRQQMSSCYLLAMENDSIKGIYNTLSDCAMISKWAGGIGLHIHNIRATGSHIEEPMGPVMVSFLCCASLTILHAMLTKEAVDATGHCRILNHGMLILRISCKCERTTVMRK